MVVYKINTYLGEIYNVEFFFEEFLKTHNLW